MPALKNVAQAATEKPPLEKPTMAKPPKLVLVEPEFSASDIAQFGLEGCRAGAAYFAEDVRARELIQSHGIVASTTTIYGCMSVLQALWDLWDEVPTGEYLFTTPAHLSQHYVGLGPDAIRDKLRLLATHGLIELEHRHWPGTPIMKASRIKVLATRRAIP